MADEYDPRAWPEEPDSAHLNPISAWAKATVWLTGLGLLTTLINIPWLSVIGILVGHWAQLVTSRQRREGKGVVLFGLGLGYLGLIPAVMLLFGHFSQGG